MAKKRDYHVVPSPRGGWNVRREGVDRITGHFDRKSDAMERGRTLAREHRTELVEHGRDGRILSNDTYGRDPNPPKDLRASRSDAPRGYGSLKGELVVRSDIDTTKPIYEQSTRDRKGRFSGGRMK
jgi:hypothetical protein